MEEWEQFKFIVLGFVAGATFVGSFISILYESKIDEMKRKAQRIEWEKYVSEIQKMPGIRGDAD